MRVVFRLLPTVPVGSDRCPGGWCPGPAGDRQVHGHVVVVSQHSGGGPEVRGALGRGVEGCVGGGHPPLSAGVLQVASPGLWEVTSPPLTSVSLSEEDDDGLDHTHAAPRKPVLFLPPSLPPSLPYSRKWYRASQELGWPIH